MANPGDKMRHVDMPNIEIELVEPTNKGWKVIQRDSKALGKKEKIAYYTSLDLFGRRGEGALFEPIKESNNLSDQQKSLKYVKLYEEFIAEGFWSGYEYKKWVKANGKIKYPKWIQEQMKEIIEGGFMDPVYDDEHNYIYLWWNSLTDDQKFNSDKRKKALGDVAAKLINDHYNDITGYTAFSFEGAAIALDISKQVEDKLANGEVVEPAYYLAKEYFKNIGKDYNRSRVFNAAHEKLAEWMKRKVIKTK